MFILPKKEDADFIVEHSKQFFRKDFEFLGKKTSVYHYKQAKFEEFEKFKEKGSYELRGLTFIEDKRFLALHKFFELNQAPGWMEEDLKNKKVIKATEKIDGTMLQPVKLKEGIFFKSKLRFDSYEALRANEIMKENRNIKEFIEYWYSQGKIPIFEYISPKTQVVMDYNREDLICIQVRDLKSGEYVLDFEKTAKRFSVSYPEVCTNSFESFLKEKNICESKEGWVLIFEDMQFVKVKTAEYLKRHEILAKIQPHNIIGLILDKKLDEVKSVLNRNSQRFLQVKEIEEKFLKKYRLLKKEAKKALKLPKKEFRKRYANHPYYELFALCRNKGLEEFDPWVKKHTARLKGAKKFLEMD
jgi:RNA ligase